MILAIRFRATGAWFVQGAWYCRDAEVYGEDGQSAGYLEGFCDGGLAVGQLYGPVDVSRADLVMWCPVPPPPALETTP